ncbi:MAG: lactonase family protein [Saprospiraceae bacterium]|nr:lactonase family protein [Saprospiraceae bacterium]
MLFSIAGLMANPLAGQADYFLVVGTYSTTPSDGIEVFSFDSHNGAFQFVQKTAAKNPSFLAISPVQKHLYAVGESGQPSGGIVSSYTLNASNGHLEWLNSQSSMGNHPCYVSVHKSGHWIAASNYSSGNLVYYPTAADGSLQAPINIQHQGSSVVKGRQDGPHAHSAVFSPDYKYLLVQDLGMDKIMIYPIDGTGKINQNKPSFYKTKPGAGPRHLEFHPNGKWAYLMEELSGNLTALSYSKGKLKELNSLNAYPSEYKGPYGSADVHVSPDGKYVYGSNRGESNTLGIFKIDQSNGKISMVGTQSTLGQMPRNFSFDPTGNYLLAANQNSNDVVVFKVNKDTGLLTDTGTRLTVNKPVCLKWVKKQ